MRLIILVYFSTHFLFGNYSFGQKIVSDDKFCFGTSGFLQNSQDFDIKNKHFRVLSSDSFAYGSNTFKVPPLYRFSHFQVYPTHDDTIAMGLSSDGKYFIWDETRFDTTAYLLTILDSGIYDISDYQVSAIGKKNVVVIPVSKGKVHKPFELFKISNTPGGYFGYRVTLFSNGSSLISTFSVRGKVSVNGQLIHDDEELTGFYVARYSYNGTLIEIVKLAESKDIIHNSKLYQSKEGFLLTFSFFDSLNIGNDSYFTIKPNLITSKVSDLMVVGITSNLTRSWHRVLRSEGDDSDVYTGATKQRSIWIKSFLWARKFWFGTLEYIKEKSINSLTMIRIDKDGNPVKVLEIKGLTQSTGVEQAIESDTSVLLSVSHPDDTVRIDGKPYMLRGKGYKAVYFRLFNSGNSELIGGLKCNNSDYCYGTLDWLPADKMYSLVVNTDEKTFTFLSHTFTNDCMMPSKRYGRYLVFEDLTTHLAERSDKQLGLIIHPNPATVHFSWQSEILSSAQSVAIYDLRGSLIKVLTEAELSAQSADIAALARGVYMIRFQTEAGTASAKLVLK